MKLVIYDNARKAMAELHRVDEVKDIRDKAIAMETYAKHAKDTKLVSYATEVRKRAERRLGELMEKQPKAKGGQPYQKKSTTVNKTAVEKSLKEQGIDENLAKRARKAAAMPEEQFEAEVAKTVKKAVAIVEDDKSIISEVRAEQQQEKAKRRGEREQELGAKLMAMPKKKFGVIYADPPWKFAVYNEDTGSDRAASNHYPTMTTECIKELNIPSADDCVLFLWATAPMLPEALDTMEAWGFKYKSHCIWNKQIVGTGYWFRNQHELLLVGTKGKIPAPNPGTQYASVQASSAKKHSEKPFLFREMIEELFPTLPKIELFARKEYKGWTVWGNETDEDDDEDES